jgi:hypothetical protein
MNPAETENVRVHYVRVVNNLPFAFTDRHDGVPVTIPPGKSENLPLDMAAHFFGYTHHGIEKAVLFRHTAKRQGWNTPEFVKIDPDTGKSKAEEYFDKLRLEPVIYKMVPVENADPATPVPADTSEVYDDTHPRKRANMKAQRIETVVE